MVRELSFEVVGDVNDIEWNPSEWTDADSIEDFKEQLIDLAEEQSSWGIQLVGTTIEQLWEEVLKAKELEDG